MKLSGAKCGECPLRSCGDPIVQPIGTHDGPVVTLDWPDKRSLADGQLAGRQRRELSKAFGHTRFATVYALACRPNDDVMTRSQRAKALEACRPRFVADLQRARRAAGGRRTLLVPTGDSIEAALGVQTIKNWAGGLFEPVRPLPVPFDTVVPTFSPRFVGQNPHYRTTFQTHVRHGLELRAGAAPPRWPRIVTSAEHAWSEVETHLRSLLDAAELGIDTESAGRRTDDDLVDVGLASPALAVCFDWRYAPDTVRHLAIEVIKSARRRVFHNAMWDVPLLKHHTGLDLLTYAPEHPFDDSMALHRIVAPRVYHDLGTTMASVIANPRHKTLFKEGDDSPQRWSSDEYRQQRETYCAKDAWGTLVSWEKMWAKLPKFRQRTYASLVWQSRLACKMRSRGVLVDLERAKPHAVHYERKIKETTEVVLACMQEAGISKPDVTPKCVRAAFESLGIEARKRSALGTPVFDKAELSRIRTHRVPGDDGSPVPTLAARLAGGELDRRAYSKRYAVYIRDLPAYVCRDGRVRTSWTPGMVSGRWSASNPGLHQMPKVLRDIYVASPGHSFVLYDKATLEPRVLAVLSNDPHFLAAVGSGKVYESIAVRMFGLNDISEVTKLQRQMGKKTQLAMSYGSGDRTMADAIAEDAPGFTPEQAGNLRASYEAAYPKIKEFQDGVVASAGKYGELRHPDSELWYPMPDGPDVPACKNQPIQAGAHDVVLAELMDLERELPRGAHIVIFLHDEIVVETPDSLLDETKRVMVDVASRVRTIRGNSAVFPSDHEVRKAWGVTK